ncbi:MAG: hypothetical protein JSR66_11145 [Proteobacteria bacterium]|nr:hypothetical protein [Pseudomonadota bacterium]
MQLNEPLARPHTAPEVSDPAAVTRATELLVHSMQEADAPIADVSEALTRMAAALNEPTVDVEALRAVFARNIAVCIESLQSYDRLMQQLVRARELLTGTNIRIAGGPPARVEGTIELF